MTTITQQIRIACQRTHTNIILDHPPACTALLERSRAASIPLTQFYVVSHPLTEGILGAYDHTTGEAWCYAPPENEGGDKQLLQHTLMLIAYASLRQSPLAKTVEEDWQRQEAAIEQAYTLGQQWQMPNIFSLKEKEALLQEKEQQYYRRLVSAEAAGTRNPHIARIAYSTLEALRHTHGWNQEQFWERLLGEGNWNSTGQDSEEMETALLQFDRTKLRPRWTYAIRNSQDGNGFGAAAIPQTADSRRLLRSTLAQCAHASPRQKDPLPTIERQWFNAPLHLHFLTIESDLDLPYLLDLINMWLVEDHTDAYAEVMWWYYSDENAPNSPRLYRLMVHYTMGSESSPQKHTLPTGHELWVLFFPSPRQKVVEAAFQEFIRSWLGEVQALRCEQMHDGLQMLWSWLSHSKQTAPS